MPGTIMLDRGVLAVDREMGTVTVDMDMDTGARFIIRDSRHTRAVRGRGRRGLLLFRGRGISEDLFLILCFTGAGVYRAGPGVGMYLGVWASLNGTHHGTWVR